MQFIAVTICVTLIILINERESAKILAVIPTPSISHQVPFRPLLHELARRGHQVTVITTDPAFPKGQTPNNLTEIDLHVSYDAWREGFVKLVKGSSNDHIEVIRAGMLLLNDVIDVQMQSEEVQKIIHGKQEYDLLILEAWIQGLLAFTHRFNVPVIQMSSFSTLWNNYPTFGLPVHPLLYPLASNRKLYNRTFWKKIDEIYVYYSVVKMFEEGERNQMKIFKKYFGDDLPSAHELRNRADLLFLNIHPIFEGNYPVPTSVVYIWGIHNKPEKELPQDLQSYLDSSKHGVIYMSFGTNTDPANLPQATIQTFVRVFSELPYNVLLKWSGDELPGKSDNIKIGKWFPQADLLKHPKIKLFITQAGLQSTDEAITAGVPLVALPVLGDQWYNAQKYRHFGIGEQLDIETVTDTQFKATIETVINTKSYRANIIKLRELMRDEPQPPLERAVWWVEYLLRHGGAKHLRSPAANISWTQYFEIELLSILLIGAVAIISLVAYSLYFIYVYLANNTFSKSTPKKQKIK